MLQQAEASSVCTWPAVLAVAVRHQQHKQSPTTGCNAGHAVHILPPCSRHCHPVTCASGDLSKVTSLPTCFI
jgi:hypothetical protein